MCSAAVDTAKTPAVPARGPRIIIACLTLLVALMFAASSAAVAHELHHDCTGDGCAVCAEMAGNLHVARGGLALPAAPATPAAAALLGALLVIGAERVRFSLTTLVALKVQLND